MRRIRLSRDEKTLPLLLINGEEGNSRLLPEVRRTCAAASLEERGLVHCAWTEGGGLDGIRLTPKGRAYVENNPKLRNPLFPDMNRDTISWIICIACLLAVLTATAIRLLR